MLPTSICKSTGSKPLADITSSTLNKHIHTMSTQHTNNISCVGNHTELTQLSLSTEPTPHTYGRRSVHGLNLLHKFHAVVGPGQTGSEIPNVASKRKTPDINNVDHLASPSIK